MKKEMKNNQRGLSQSPSQGLNLVVMIPAYNEQATIQQVINSIPKHIPDVASIRIIVIDDGSRDNTAEVAKSAGADLVIKNKENLGLGRTFRRGIEESLKLGADIIVNIDADAQFDGKDIPKLIAPIINNGADMVTVSRFLQPELTTNMPRIRKFGNTIFTNIINRLTHQRFSDTQCGFRAYSREAALRLNLFGTFTYTQEVFLDLASKNMKIREIPIPVKYETEIKNKAKRSSAISSNLKKYTLRSLGIIIRTARDMQPLTFFSIPALLLFVLGFIGALYSFIYWLTHLMTTPVRMLFNVSVFLLIFGLSLGILGLLADMLVRIRKTQEEILYKLKKTELGER